MTPDASFGPFFFLVIIIITYGPNDGKPSFGPSYVDGGGRRLSSSYVLDGLAMG